VPQATNPHFFLTDSDLYFRSLRKMSFCRGMVLKDSSLFGATMEVYYAQAVLVESDQK
jgi:hypothetical protein